MSECDDVDDAACDIRNVTVTRCQERRAWQGNAGLSNHLTNPPCLMPRINLNLSGL